jgi:replicative DNA helicase Mcm
MEMNEDFDKEDKPKPGQAQEELIAEAKTFFNTYKKQIGLAAKKGDKVIQVTFEDLAENSPTLSENIIIKPEETLELLEVALVESGMVSNARVRLNSLAKTQEVFVRNIRAKHLGTMISVDGIVRQASEVRPQVVNAKFECPSCGSIISVLQLDKKFKEPSRCSCGRHGGFRELSKDMVDAQRIVIEESPDSLSGGEQPKRMQIFLKEDLVDPKMEDRTTPGSKIKIIGVLKEVSIPTATGGIQTRFELAIEANNVIPMEETFDEILISEEDERAIKELAAHPKVIERLIQSIAPSVWGHEEIKKALALQLFGGVKKLMKDGTRKRGDIHILLVGDPGVAKSVMLKFISGIAPKGRYVSGKSTSGAGLTATVVKDEFLRGWALEAGALVLSNKGLVCIDELEKMDENDRSTMHEAMEQQTITISKANVQATLNSQTAILAAANPKFGRFDPTQMIAKQVDLAPSLLNRFDVIFIMKDMPDRNRDESIADHVLKGHKDELKSEIIDKELLRKYVAYARQRVNPTLSEEAVEEIKTFYVELRNKPTFSDTPIKPIPISARQLEALIRISEAIARAKLAKKVTKEDSRQAIELVKYYLMKVGFDEETKTFDIDRISGTPASSRSKIRLVLDAIEKLESKLGKLIPVEELQKELGEQIKELELEEAVEKLVRSGDLFKPRKGYIQKM